LTDGCRGPVWKGGRNAVGGGGFPWGGESLKRAHPAGIKKKGRRWEDGPGKKVWFLTEGINKRGPLRVTEEGAA